MIMIAGATVSFGFLTNDETFVSVAIINSRISASVASASAGFFMRAHFDAAQWTVVNRVWSENRALRVRQEGGWHGGTSQLTQVMRDLLVQNLADGQCLNLTSFLSPKTIDLKKCIACELKADEVTEHALFAHQDGLESVDVGTTDLGGLLDLDGIPFVHEIHFAG